MGLSALVPRRHERGIGVFSFSFVFFVWFLGPTCTVKCRSWIGECESCLLYIDAMQEGGDLYADIGILLTFYHPEWMTRVYRAWDHDLHWTKKVYIYIYIYLLSVCVYYRWVLLSLGVMLWSLSLSLSLSSPPLFSSLPIHLFFLFFFIFPPFFHSYISFLYPLIFFFAFLSVSLRLPPL